MLPRSFGDLESAVERRGVYRSVPHLSETTSEFLGMDEPRRRFAAMMSGLDIHYDLGEGHPLLGRRMPDLDLITANAPTAVLIRPDGYVAWVGDLTQLGLADALTTWFGPHSGHRCSW